MKSFIGLILSKKSSKRLPGKNTLDFKGKPMFLENTKKLLSICDKVYVSSDSQWILDQAKAIGAIPIWRSSKLCGDVPNIPVYRHAVSKMGDIEGIIAIQANSPTIDVNLIVLAKRIMEMGVQELMTCHKDNSIYGSIWAMTKKKLEKYDDFYHPRPDVLLYDSSIDIHSFDDYELACQQ